MTTSQPTVLIIEDDAQIRKFLKIILTSNKYHVIESVDGANGLLQAASAQPDLIILDLGLPDIDGIDLTRQLREWSKTPIIIVSARGREQDKVVALDSGAQDYLTKPFGTAELLARVRAVLRDTVKADSGDSLIKTGDLTIDLARRRILLGDQPVHLTPNEYRILSILARHIGKVITHRQLLQEVWGPNSLHDTHYLRVYINQIRQKIELNHAQPKHLITEPGVGYRLVE